MCCTGSQKVLFRRLDIADPASVDDFGMWAEVALKSVDILVNNAGVMLPLLVESTNFRKAVASHHSCL